jgi:hypothetical protein
MSFRRKKEKKKKRKRKREKKKERETAIPNSERKNHITKKIKKINKNKNNLAYLKKNDMKILTDLEKTKSARTLRFLVWGFASSSLPFPSHSSSFFLPFRFPPTQPIPIPSQQEQEQEQYFFVLKT